MSLILDHVSHIYGEDTKLAVAALKDVNLVIPDGQFIGLIGHTGSGKSTLVQHLNGLLQPTSGTIYFNGQDISDKDYNKIVMQGIPMGYAGKADDLNGAALLLCSDEGRYITGIDLVVDGGMKL